jgi:hypothetical protein
MQHMRLGIFETRKAHRRRPAILQHGFYGCSDFFLSILAFLASIPFFSSTIPGRDESSGYLLAAGMFPHFGMIVFDFHLIRFAEGSQRASERLEGETHVWDDFPSL